jgi:hypothetical protein
VHWKRRAAGCYQTLQMIVCRSYWLGHLRMHCHIVQCDPCGALPWKLAENITAYKSVFTYDYIVLSPMRYFTLIFDCVEKEGGNREWRTLQIHRLPDVSSSPSSFTVNR